MKTIKKESPKATTTLCKTSAIECESPQRVDGILKKLDEAIKKRNENFSSMSKSEQRTEIAKDVIASLNSKKYIAKRGTYVELFDKKKKTNESENNGISLTRDNLNKESTVCHVCAIGSVFTSFAQKTKSPLTSESNSMLRSMNSIFSETEMRILEMLFEGSFIDDQLFKELELEQRNIIKIYGSQFKKLNKGGADKRLRAIMDNIIKNKGNFKFGKMVLNGTF